MGFSLTNTLGFCILTVLFLLEVSCLEVMNSKEEERERRGGGRGRGGRGGGEVEVMDRKFASSVT